MRDIDDVDGAGPASVTNGIEPWPACAYGDAAVMRVTGPVEDQDATATIVMADCTNSVHWLTPEGH